LFLTVDPFQRWFALFGGDLETLSPDHVGREARLATAQQLGERICS